jgi:hypothetical protein
MRFPSKYTSYKSSVISKFPVFLEELSARDLTIKELYKKTKSKVQNVQEFIEVLDCLYAIKKIEIFQEVVHYVERDSL